MAELSQPLSEGGVTSRAVRRPVHPLLLGTLVAALAGCGHQAAHGISTPAARPAPVLLAGPQSCNPPEGTGRPGVCNPKTVGAGKPVSIGGRLVPDVSSYQGHPNWGTAKRYISGAIVKAGEGAGYTDPTFAYNWGTLRRLGVWHTAYYFVRNTSCQVQVSRFVAIVRSSGGFDSGPPVLDVEVPLSPGLVPCLVAGIETATHRRAIIYTAPGTWPGGGHGDALLWVASYGSSPGCVWTCAHVAWQFTGDGLGPSPHSLPGVGSSIDISTDNGITRLTSHPVPKPKPCGASCQRSRHLGRLYIERRQIRARLPGMRRTLSNLEARGNAVNRAIRVLGGK